MKGLLMINLGSPDSTDVKDVKKYLDEFLMDERVIGKSYWFRWFLVKVIIYYQLTACKIWWNLTSKKSSTETEYELWKILSCSFTFPVLKKSDFVVPVRKITRPCSRFGRRGALPS